MTKPAVEDRLAAVIGAVIAQALSDARASGAVLLDDGSPEAGLAERLLRPSLGERLAVLAIEGGSFAAVLRGAALAAETRPDALCAHPVNKTAALLGGAPPLPLLPLADLWASDVEQLAQSCSVPERVRAALEAAGGLLPLDRALRRYVDRRLPAEQAFDEVPSDARGTILALWEDTRFSRRRLGLVPKLSARTLGVDLFD